MPFEKGNTINTGKVNNPKGRKGYEWEESQIKKMRTLVTRILNLSGKIYSGKASDKEIESFKVLSKFSGKVIDKLHASKQHTELDIPDLLSEVKITIVKTKEDIRKSNEHNETTKHGGVSEELRTVPKERKKGSN